MKKTIKATSLNTTQLKMLDIGAPVIVSCKTVNGDVVQVRLQSQNLDVVPADQDKSLSADDSDNATGSWEKHGVYVAIMPNGPDYGS